ncbi:MAG: protease modulator HflC [Lentisphaerae bacterium]|nr:protease modulator HflC [Lentisphaerota bacterium]
MAANNFFKHWPTWVLGLLVATILLFAVFSFQLNQTEAAVVTTFGRPAQVTEPGLHFRWPYPFQRIYRFDKRIRCFAGGAGKLEETTTSDGHNLLVGIYVNFRISNAEKFFKTLENMTQGEEKLNSLMRGYKNAAIGEYRFSQIINTNPKEMKLQQIQKKIQQNLAAETKDYGLEIIDVGISSINVPKSISEKVADRMIAERKVQSDAYISEGNARAKQIRTEADTSKTIQLADAEAKARTIRAAGDAEAAKYYATFTQNPELAEFLLKLDSLRKIMKGRTTLVTDYRTAPFDILQQGAEVLKSNKGK